ncbi:MAG: tetratricopeptide repeat protein, partial [Candidatus Paceibacterota bacterium]
ASEDRTAKVQNYIASSINLARRATEVGPKEATNWSNLGAVYQSLLGFVDGVEKLSEDAYLRAADLRPGDASYFNQIGATYLASADLARRLSASGGADKARFQAAVGPALEKAEENFKKAIDVSNNFGLAIYNLGVVYDRQGKLGEAITQLERIMPFNSNQPGLAFELGLLYYRVGQKDKASNELQRAVLLSPDFANARWYLALIYEERQDFDSAIDQLEKILSVEANKNNAEVLAKLEQLRSGQKASPPKKVIDQKPL